LNLEAAGAKRMEMERLVEQAVQLAGEFDRAFAEGTIEEKRLLVRAFVKEIVVDPGKGAVWTRMIVVPGGGAVMEATTEQVKRVVQSR